MAGFVENVNFIASNLSNITQVSNIDEALLNLDSIGDSRTNVRNASGSTIPKGTIVVFDPANQSGTDHIEVVAVTNPQTQIACGVAVTDILDGSTGLILIKGVIDNIDTSHLSVGLVYPTDTGEFTNTAPNNPTLPLRQIVGLVFKVDALNGKIFCDFINPYLYASTTDYGMVLLRDDLITDSDQRALTARQGKVLKDLVDTKLGNDSAQALHATDALSVNLNILSLNKADGTSEVIDLTPYLDDTNLSKITSGTYVVDEPLVGDKNLKFVRDDASVFYIDASMFFDDTNLVTSVANRTGVVTLTADDITDTVNKVTITPTQETNFETAYSHSQAAHAPSNADNTAANETSHANVVEKNVANTFTAVQTFTNITETVTSKAASFTPNLSTEGTIFEVTASAIVTMPTASQGKSFVVFDTGAFITGWGLSPAIRWKGGAVPTYTSIAYFVFECVDGVNWDGQMVGGDYAAV